MTPLKIKSIFSLKKKGKGKRKKNWVKDRVQKKIFKISLKFPVCEVKLPLYCTKQRKNPQVVIDDTESSQLRLVNCCRDTSHQNYMQIY